AGRGGLRGRLPQHGAVVRSGVGRRQFRGPERGAGVIVNGHGPSMRGTSPGRNDTSGWFTDGARRPARSWPAVHGCGPGGYACAMTRLRDSVRRRRGNTESVPPQALAPASPDAPAEPDLAGEFAELARELPGADETRQRRALAAVRRRVSRSGAVTWHGARSAGHWMAEQVISMAPRVPGRD